MRGMEQIDLKEILGMGLQKDKMYKVEFYLVPEGDGHIIEDVMVMGVLKARTTQVLQDDEVTVTDVTPEEI